MGATTADPLRELMEKYAPGCSVRQLTRAAGVPNERLAYWLRPDTVFTRMPTVTQIVEIARIIGAPPGETYQVFRKIVDPGAYLDDDVMLGLLLNEGEQELLAAYRRLPRALQCCVVRIVKLLGEEHQSSR